MSEGCNLLLDYFNTQLNEEETKEFELHLSTCTACQEELNELRELTADLPYSSEPIDPPVDMKERIFDNILNQTDETKEDEQASEQADSKEKAPVHPSHIPKQKRSRWYQPLIAAVLTLSLVGNGIALFYFTDDAKETAPPPEKESLDTMRDMISLSPSEGVKAEATAMMIEQDNDTNLVVQAADLPILKGDETYQVWVLQDGEPSRAGTFILNENGMGAVSHILKNKTAHNWDTIAITKEPDANSQKPQGEILLSAPL